MLKKTITYEGLDGTDVTEDFYFHLSRANLIEIDMKIPGGFTAMLDKIIKSDNTADIYNEFKKIIIMSVGKRSEDGKRFIKSDDIRSDFENTEAYSELILELMEDENKASQFINGLVHKDISGGALTTVTPAAPPAGLSDTPYDDGKAVSLSAADEEEKIRNEFAVQATPQGNRVMSQEEAAHLMASDLPEFQSRMQSGWVISNDPGARILTPAEIAEMDPHILKSGLASGKYKIG